MADSTNMLSSINFLFVEEHNLSNLKLLLLLLLLSMMELLFFQCLSEQAEKMGHVELKQKYQIAREFVFSYPFFLSLLLNSS